MSNTSLLGSFGGQAGESLMFRNRIINGDMRIDQRNAGAAVSLTAGGGIGFAIDRSYCGNFTDGTATIRQVTTISGATNFEANSAPENFTHALKWTVTGADASLASTQSAFIAQIIEGLNVADFGWGTAAAKPISVSFWVKASATGTFGGGVTNHDYTRGYAFSFAINNANTWEYKTVVISGDTSGTWVTNNSAGLRLHFCLAAASDRAATPGSWVSSVVIGATGQTNFMASAVGSPTFYITGVQLESGTATPFERRPIGQELMLCQRYFDTNYPTGVAPGTAIGDFPGAIGVKDPAGNEALNTCPFHVTMRAKPTVTLYHPGQGTANAVEEFSGGVKSATINTNRVSSSGFTSIVITSPAAGVKVYFYVYTANAEL